MENVSKGPTLLVLAAGMGSRYGGLKQVDPVGPSGETILDYAVFDAVRAGFARVVFVIRRDFEEAFRTQVAAKYAGRVDVGFVFQALDDLPGGFAPPAGREKPWGTGHAVWCARREVRENFAVINADDFYGADSFRQLAGFFSEKRESGSEDRKFAIVGFRLGRTLSENGAVSRGICTAGTDGLLRSITERTGILREQVGPGGAAAGREFTGDEIVSMNCWAFTPAVFAALDRQFAAFLAARGGEAKSEFYLPEAVSGQIAAGEATVRVLTSGAAWFGVTYREDKPRVQAALTALVAAGDYPAKLF